MTKKSRGTKRHVCFVITARPSYARVRSAISAALEHPGLHVSIIGTASFLANRFGTAANVLAKDGFELAWKIHTLFDENGLSTAAKTTSIQLAELSTAFENLKPDMVVSVADRYETMATAIAAAYMNIPLVHLQGGEVTGNIDEKVRHAITKLADLHLVSNEDSRDRVIRLGEQKDKVHITGCPSIDIARKVKSQSEEYSNPLVGVSPVGTPIDLDRPFVVVMQHPVTTKYTEARSQLESTLAAAATLSTQVVWFWPNPDLGSSGASEAIRAFRETTPDQNIAYVKNLDPEHFLALLTKASCLIGNSSVGIRECSFLGVPVVNIGNRQRKRLRANNVIDVPQDTEAISTSAKIQIAHVKYEQSNIYGTGDAGTRIASLLATEPLGFEKQITY